MSDQELVRTARFSCGHFAPLRVSIELDLPGAARVASESMDAATARAAGMPCEKCARGDTAKWHDRLNNDEVR